MIQSNQKKSHVTRQDQGERDFNHHRDFLELYKACPLPDGQKIKNLGLFAKRQSLSRIMYMYELYKKIINVHGIIVEFGVRWGQNLALFQNFRAMFEPYNYTRKIVGFDTFSGFPNVSHKDITNKHSSGDMYVAEQYEDYLEKLLQAHENNSPVPNVKKFEICKGDAIVTFKQYLDRNPETIIALAYFDFDLYEPTKVCLELCKDRLTKGSIIGFDELNHPNWPGETIAVQEILGLNNIRLQRMPFNPTTSFIEIE